MSGSAGNMILHLTSESGGLPLTTLNSSGSTVVGAGFNNFTIPCTDLASSTSYGFWTEYVSGGAYSVPSGVVSTYSGGTMSRREPSDPALVPNTTKTADVNFIVYGDSGTCSGGGGEATSTVATTTPQQDANSISFGIAIIIVILSVGVTAYVWNSLRRKKEWR